MLNFCTYFNKNYILRGLTLYRSLKTHAQEFTLYVVCLDDYTFELIKKLSLDDLTPIKLADIENRYPELAGAKANRSPIEYFFTLTPIIPLYLFEKYPTLPSITYLDADLLFYSDPAPIFNELGKNSILITPHRFPPKLKELEHFGLFNVQLIIYRNDRPARDCLEKYKRQCIDWCYDTIDGNRYADQKYLDEWPFTYPVSVLQHKGAGLAPWNWMQYSIKIDKQNISAFIDNEPLIFYHFHGLKFVTPFILDHGLNNYKHLMPHYLLHFFYKNYVKQLQSTEEWILDKTELKDHLYCIDFRYRNSFMKQILIGLLKRNLSWI